jgi:hypothetical protein
VRPGASKVLAAHAGLGPAVQAFAAWRMDGNETSLELLLDAAANLW